MLSALCIAFDIQKRKPEIGVTMHWDSILVRYSPLGDLLASGLVGFLAIVIHGSGSFFALWKAKINGLAPPCYVIGLY